MAPLNESDAASRIDTARPSDSGPAPGLAVERRNNFDALRLLLAIAVIFGHSWPLLIGPQTLAWWTHDPLYRLTNFQYDSAYLAVNCFFVLSGYLIVASWERSRSVGDFLKRRVLRIYPAFILVSLVCGLIVGPSFAARPGSYFAEFDARAFLVGIATLRTPIIPEVFPHNVTHDISGSLWTIRYEFLCYLLVVVLGLATRRSMRTAVTVLGLVSMAIFSSQHYGWFRGRTDLPILGDLWNWPRFLACFLGGAMLWLHRDRVRLSLPGALVAAALLGVAMWFRVVGSVFPLVGAYLLLALGADRRLGLWRLTRTQDWSYGTYCFAYPIQQMIIAVVGTKALTPWSLFAIALPLTLVVAALSWNFVEEPALRWKNRRLLGGWQVPGRPSRWRAGSRGPDPAVPPRDRRRA